MAFISYKSVADFLESFPLNYQEQNFVEGVAFECDEYFVSRLNTIVQGDSIKRLFGMVSNGKLWELGVLQENMFTKEPKILYFGKFTGVNGRGKLFVCGECQAVVVV